MAAPTISAPAPSTLTTGLRAVYRFTVTNNSTSNLQVNISTPPSGMVPSGNSLVGTPDSAGTYSTEIAASNADGSTIVTVTFTVVNPAAGAGPPVIVSTIGSLFLVPQVPIFIPLGATGAMPISWAVNGLPSRLGYSPSNIASLNGIYGYLDGTVFSGADANTHITVQIVATNNAGEDSQFLNLYSVNPFPAMQQPVSGSAPSLGPPTPLWSLDPTALERAGPFNPPMVVLNAASLLTGGPSVASYTISGLPDGWTYNSATGNILAPPGPVQGANGIQAVGGTTVFMISITATDSLGGSNTLTVPFIVTAPTP